MKNNDSIINKCNSKSKKENDFCYERFFENSLISNEVGFDKKNTNLVFSHLDDTIELIKDKDLFARVSDFKCCIMDQALDADIDKFIDFLEFDCFSEKQKALILKSFAGKPELSIDLLNNILFCEKRCALFYELLKSCSLTSSINLLLDINLFIKTFYVFSSLKSSVFGDQKDIDCHIILGVLNCISSYDSFPKKDFKLIRDFYSTHAFALFNEDFSILSKDIDVLSIFTECNLEAIASFNKLALSN